MDNKYPLEGASDHGVSEAVYLSDPDGNGIELYADRPKEKWPKNADGTIDFGPPKPLSFESLFSELKE